MAHTVEVEASQRVEGEAIKGLEKLGEVDEAEQVKHQPASLFYILDWVESKRWAKDSDMDPLVSAAKRKANNKASEAEEGDNEDDENDEIDEE